MKQMVVRTELLQSPVELSSVEGVLTIGKEAEGGLELVDLVVGKVIGLGR